MKFILSLLSKIPSKVKIVLVLLIVGVSVYYVVDYVDTKNDLSTITEQKEKLESDVKNLEKKLTKNKINFDNYKSTSDNIDRQYRESLEELNELERLLDDIQVERDSEESKLDSSKEESSVRSSKVLEAEQRVNTLFKTLSTQMECQTGDRTKC